MTRKIIAINSEKCNGCGLCAEACHEGAIAMENGKAKLMRDDYCDGLGNCLPVCPTGAIAFEEREAAAYNEEAVKRNAQQRAEQETLACGCPGSQARAISREEMPEATEAAPGELKQQPRLMNWPVQIKLAPANASWLDNAELLIAADCAAYAYGGFHEDFMRGKITLIGCPKLDGVDYSEKLAEIIRSNSIKSVTVVRMEVPCCGGIEHAVLSALESSGKMLPRLVVTLSAKGDIVRQ